MKKLGALLALSAAAACGTPYQRLGLRGGFSETQLNANTYQVRMQGNGNTTRERTSQYLLRRCAELTLERNKRYFLIGADDSQTATSGYDGMAFSFPSGAMRVTLLNEKREDAVDAVLIIDQTNIEADDRISAAASNTYRQFKQAERVAAP